MLGERPTADAPRGDEYRLQELSAAIVFASVLSGLVLCAAVFGRHLLRPASVNHVTARVIDAFRLGDARAYEDIAENGYSWNGDALAKANIAFFPLYPLLGRAVSRVSGVPAIGALMFLSNLAFIGACALLWLHLARRAPEQAPRLPWHAVLLMSVFPTGCFFRFAFTEALFLLLAVASLHLIERRARLAFICAVIGLATATRPIGAALLFALAISIIERNKPLAARLVMLCWALPLACWGIAALAYFDWTAFGDPLAFVWIQAAWCLQPDDTAADKWISLLTGRAIRTVYDPASGVYWAKRDLHGILPLSMHFANPLVFISAVASVVLGARRRWLTRPEIAFSAAALAIPYFFRAHEMGMGSMARFVAVVFPVYIVGGHLLSRAAPPISAAIVCVMVSLLVSYAALYSAGYSIY